ncbi:hypothetical protein [Brevibacillus sp. H7]|jgi:hypothetical protein|uniref:hypothetical protein n=1 Tax=Brevibacillus sp. H7 TaxID=3349138 RepID=UPI00382B80A6
MICFAILAHQNEKILANQIANIKKCNPNCIVVLYNGGRNKHFGKTLGIPICPYSRPLRYGRLGRFFYDIMRWLEARGIHYDYLVNLDSDLMFVKPGYEQFLDQVMNGYDCMGFRLKAYRTPLASRHWLPGRSMWKEWKSWKPFFRSSYFYGTLNAMQVYRQGIVRKMLRNLNRIRLERLLKSTKVFALEEILYVTLAARRKGRMRTYPHRSRRYVRLSRPLTLPEARRAKKDPYVYFAHPIRRTLHDPARRLITQSSFPRQDVSASVRSTRDSSASLLNTSIAE